jgi:hypothetical protein
VFAPAEAARHAQRTPLGVDDDDRVKTVGLAGPAEILDALAGAILAGLVERHELVL